MGIVVCVRTPGREGLEVCFDVYTSRLPLDHPLITHRIGRQCDYGGYRKFLQPDMCKQAVITTSLVVLNLYQRQHHERCAL